MKHCDCKSGNGVLVGMVGAGFLAIGLSESLGKWKPVAVLVAIIVGGLIGICADVERTRRCEQERKGDGETP